MHPNNVLLHLTHPWNVPFHPNNVLLHPNNNLIHRRGVPLHPNNVLLHPNNDLMHPRDVLLHLSNILLYRNNDLMQPGDALLHPKNVLLTILCIRETFSNDLVYLGDVPLHLHPSNIPTTSCCTSTTILVIREPCCGIQTTFCRVQQQRSVEPQ